MEVKELPSDILFEILTWSDVESLFSYRWVCKGWQRLFSESHFIHHHLQRTQTIRGFFMQTYNRWHHHYRTSFVSLNSSTSSEAKQQPSLSFLPKEVKIEASTAHGLLCCMSIGERNPSFYVCKPTTEEWTQIPNPKTRYLTRKMGMVVVSMNPLRFKIVRCSEGKFMEYRCEVFDSKTWRWTMLPQVRISNLCWFLLDGLGTFVNGCFYWLTLGSHKGQPIESMFYVDIMREQWGLMELPQVMVREEEEQRNIQMCYSRQKLLVNMGGNLSVVCVDENHMEVWIMENKLVRRWERRQMVDLQQLKAQGGHKFHASYAADIALVTDSWRKLFWYNYDNNTWTETEVKYGDLGWDAHFYQSNFIPTGIGKRNFDKHVEG